MKKRTFGWIQNPGKLKMLKKVVACFLYDSDQNRWLRDDRLPFLDKCGLIDHGEYTFFLDKVSTETIEINYSVLRGKRAGKSKDGTARCAGLIQAIIDGQKKMSYTDEQGETVSFKQPFSQDWSADGYLRWAISCGLLEYNGESDTCKISELGIELAQSADDSQEEKEAFTRALLSYPPVLRILNLLYEKDNQTKYELGSKLGFKGEMGFTSIPQAVYLCDYCEASSTSEKKDVRSNDEGDSDKYARGIASWCSQMGWVTASNQERTETYRGREYTASIQTFSLTRAGEKAIVRANGNSSNPRLPRVVLFEMLASNKAHGANHLRYQRAVLLKALSSSPKTLEQLKEAVKGYDIEMGIITIEDHIEGLVSIGLDIKKDGEKYKLRDRIIGLELPSRSSCIKDEVNDIVERVRERLSHVNHKYLALIDLAYSNVASRSAKNIDAREFEIQTADLFVNELGFNGMRLGDSKRPDVIISYDVNGTIIDNKSYKDGFSISRACADEMSRYINENVMKSESLNANKWWENFDRRVTTYTFLFVTSYLKGAFEGQLKYISNANGKINGAAISVENLLYFAELLKSGKITYEDFYNAFENKEMIFKL